MVYVAYFIKLFVSLCLILSFLPSVPFFESYFSNLVNTNNIHLVKNHKISSTITFSECCLALSSTIKQKCNVIYAQTNDQIVAQSKLEKQSPPVCSHHVDHRIDGIVRVPLVTQVENTYAILPVMFHNTPVFIERHSISQGVGCKALFIA